MCSHCKYSKPHNELPLEDVARWRQVVILDAGESTTGILYPGLGLPDQQRYWEAGKGLSGVENWSGKLQREAGLFGPVTGKLGDDLILVYNYLEGRYKGSRAKLLSVVPADRQEPMATYCSLGGLW